MIKDYLYHVGCRGDCYGKRSVGIIYMLGGEDGSSVSDRVVFVNGIVKSYVPAASSCGSRNSQASAASMSRNTCNMWPFSGVRDW